ncbi:RNA-guided endonuclease InsQ/TnpB family protein [Marinomonas algarum]|uniref:Transposase n=1 Tax=Marinomonas algarum TaxID=2883105 RepID=A0A9X1IME9_9GAMM|nr:RNA-guided endonuclease TnpB family protein [Marinomonas algarum]MCB5161433.1 transposase [Marinomonas algarum]MCB5161494.1 transposase [Marinomonas algarum]
MAIRGFSINISDKLSGRQATCFAQWIGASNVMRNQKLSEYVSLLAESKGERINQAYSHIRTNQDLPFLKEIPPQIMRNAASLAFSDVEASRVGLRKFPKKKGRGKKRSALITKEMFVLEPLNENKTLLTFFDNATKKRQKLFSIQLSYAPDQLCKQFRVSRLGEKFTLSGSYNDGVELPTNEVLLGGFAGCNDDDLLAQITGIDRGVVLPACTSEGARYAYSPTQTAKLKALNKRKARYQRILSNKKRLNKNKNKHRCESKGQRKLAVKISKLDSKTANIRENFCHTISKEIVMQAKPIISLEDLKLVNMTSKAKPKRNATGRKYVKNNGKAKSGLNRSLLNVSLGRLGTYIKCKASDHGKAVVEVNPSYTSRTCHVCKTKNTTRPNQSTLVCLNGCGTFHADENAAKVIAQRAVTYIKESTFADKAKTRKKTAIRKKKAVSPPLVNELSSVKKSGKLEAVSSEMSPCLFAQKS